MSDCEGEYSTFCVVNLNFDRWDWLPERNARRLSQDDKGAADNIERKDVAN